MGFVRIHDLTDDELVRRFREGGDRAAFAELFRRYRPAIYGACLAFLRNTAEAEDLVQDAYIRAMDRIDQFRSGSFAAWLFSIARNLCINHAKSKAARHEVEYTGLLDWRAAPESSSFADGVLALLDSLPQRQRICLKLFYIGGYSYKEIAELTRCSDTDVKAYIQNGIRRLRLAWEARAVAKRGS